EWRCRRFKSCRPDQKWRMRVGFGAVRNHFFRECSGVLRELLGRDAGRQHHHEVFDLEAKGVAVQKNWAMARWAQTYRSLIRWLKSLFQPKAVESRRSAKRCTRWNSCCRRRLCRTLGPTNAKTVAGAATEMAAPVVRPHHIRPAGLARGSVHHPL